MDPSMSSDVDTGDPPAGDQTEADGHIIPVSLGRRVEVVGDLLLPAEPTDCSRAACTDIARRLEDWQGPGVVVFCGRLVARGCPGTSPAEVLERHGELTRALEAFAD